MNPSGKISERAFTLVELMVVMAIIAILATFSMGIYSSAKRKGVESRLKTELAAIELALENFKAKNSQYPYSEPWDYEYPPRDWSGSGSDPVGNQLYQDLVKEPMKAGKKPHLPNVRESQHDDNGSLLAPVADLRGGAPFVKWYYNSNNPRFNTSSYDLWVEYGDLGGDKDVHSDDTVKIISNWNK
jgi:prepilin-type N-terminal cleavage/methylation domain-containing protein